MCISLDVSVCESVCECVCAPARCLGQGVWLFIYLLRSVPTCLPKPSPSGAVGQREGEAQGRDVTPHPHPGQVIASLANTGCLASCPPCSGLPSPGALLLRVSPCSPCRSSLRCPRTASSAGPPPPHLSLSEDYLHHGPSAGFRSRQRLG